MKKLLSVILIICSIAAYSQNVDTVITNPILKSYFCREYKQPLYVAYYMYHGGGDASRGGMSFKSVKKLTAKAGDYAHSGYDEGHLASAEDFADYDSTLRYTFYFYNCVPQTPNLNRGIWKIWENTVRLESQKDSVYVICGGYNYKLVNKLYVPQNCFKIVKNMKTKKLTHVLIFTNGDPSTCVETNLSTLIKKTKYTKLKTLLK